MISFKICAAPLATSLVAAMLVGDLVSAQDRTADPKPSDVAVVEAPASPGGNATSTSDSNTNATSTSGSNANATSTSGSDTNATSTNGANANATSTTDSNANAPSTNDAKTNATCTNDANTDNPNADACTKPNEATCDEAARSVEEEVQGTAEDQASRRRRELVDDAVEALDETQKALKALEDGDTEAALDALAIATGKLDLVVARNPRLALAPVDVRAVTYDLFATMESIEGAKKEALAHMKEGRLQDARALIQDLRSDVVVEVVNVPLATYPAAIRAITPLIDDGRIDEAKASLERALNTLVVTEHAHALPVIRARHMLARAEELAETEDRSDDESGELTTLLDGARHQLEMAQALGYGKRADFEGFYEQLDQIAEKTSDGKSGSGFFDKIRSALRAFGGSDSSSS